MTRYDTQNSSEYVQIAHGKQSIVAAEKKIRLHNPHDEQIAFNEVHTLQQRKHPNIVPLLASYTFTAMESELPVTTMHLIFPYADMDLEDWMTNPRPPPCLQGLSRSERRAYLYSCISALVSGLSFLHREQGGIVTAHHDLKPHNILVFGQELKLADFGRSHLRPLAEGSETETESLGTYDYQPPEYWNDDGQYAAVKHGRVFDVWSMGCIIIELATLIAYDWEGEKVTLFREKRKKNPSKLRPIRQHYEDKSFHNNRAVVKDWIRQLEVEDASPKLKSTLNVALQMLDRTPSSRPYSWEAELDLYNIQHPDDNQVEQLEKGTLCIQPPPPRKKILNGAQTPLHRAARAGNLARLVQLFEFGWSLFVQDHNGQTAIDVFNQSQDRYACEMLQKRLAPKPPTKPTDELQCQKLLQAATEGQVEVVQELLTQGVDPMSVDKNNCSALYKAVVHNQSNVVKCLLLAKGKDLLRQKEHVWHDTPLHKAAYLGLANIMKQLLAYSPDIEDLQKESKTALWLAAEHGHEEAVQVLLDHGAQAFTQTNVKGTPLHAAARWNRVEALKRLLVANDAGKCLEHRNQWGDTPLWLAVFKSHPDCAQALVDKNASVHVANNDGQTVLHFVVENGLYDFLKKNIHLFNRQDVVSRNLWHETPLMLAQKRQKQRFEEILTGLRDRG